ncbi:caspase_family protein [Hexamita inflata]|uniref:MORN repeat-containing protein 5 n=1 Tax=Hexamita inflata TaxID=28002 RepID=A0AA86S1X9_9EUKA|nr:caspase family protein [Hexamita inflata]
MSGIEIIVTENYQYVGQVKSRQKHGKGALIFNDGGYYVGDFANDCFSGIGTYTLEQIQMFGVFKKGDFISGNLLIGKISYIIENGNYKSVLLDSKQKPYIKLNFQCEHEQIQNKLKQVTILKSQQVVHFKTDGSLVQSKNVAKMQQVAISSRYIYVGEIQYEKMNGTGVLIFNDGSVFNGQLNQGRFHGKGSFTCISGIKMIGHFSEGNFSQGQLISQDGTKIETLVETLIGNEKLQDYQLKMQNQTHIIQLNDSKKAIVQYQLEANDNQQNSVTKQNEQIKQETSSTKNELQRTKTEIQQESQQNIEIEKYKATIKELELKCQNLENTATEQKNNFSNLQTVVKNKNDQILKQELELNNLKKLAWENLNLNSENEIKLKQQQYYHDNTTQMLQQHYMNEIYKIQQTAQQYVIQVQIEAKQWIAHEQVRLAQELSVKE